MDEQQHKKEILLNIQDEAQGWLDKERLGDTIRKYHEKEILTYRRRIESKEFVKDHEGYLLALGGLQASQLTINSIQNAEARYNKATNELKALEGEDA